MISSIISRLIILLFGTLYPAYASYKAVKTKNFKEYVKWMMYWIVFAFFTCIETFTDVFLSWFPLYYEIKVILVFWLLSPVTRGSSILYRKFVHPMLSSREQEIDEYIALTKEQSYRQVLDLGSKGVSVLMQTALKGGGMLNQLRKSYSLGDLTDSPMLKMLNEQTESISLEDIHTGRKMMKRSPTAASTSSGLYFAEVDVRHDALTHIKSVEDISSGYSSGDVFNPESVAKEVRTRSGSISRTRSVRVTRSTTNAHKKQSSLTDSDEQCTYESLSDEDTSEDISIKQGNPNEAQAIALCQKLENTPENLKQEVDTKSPLSNFDASNLLSKSKSVDSLCSPSKLCNGSLSNTRAGKYNKKLAPQPPKINKDQSLVVMDNITAVKATLTLKPSKSPSLGRKCYKPNPKREKSPFTRFFTLPRKLGSFLVHDTHKDTSTSELKRSSWYAESDICRNPVLLKCKTLSKSADDVQYSS